MTGSSTPRATALHWRERHHRFTPHFHTDFTVSLIPRGDCEFSVRDERYRAAAGQFSLINPFDVHAARCGADTEYRALYCSDAYLDHLLPGLRGAMLSFGPAVYEDPALFQALRRILEADPADRGARDGLAEVLRALFTSAAVVRRPPVDGGEFRRRVADLFEQRATGPEAASIAALSAELGLSAGHFSRLFHRHFGVPAVFYRNQLRLERAAGLIGRGTSPAAAAFDCGFADQSHLTRELKKARGLTPRGWSTAFRILD